MDPVIAKYVNAAAAALGALATGGALFSTLFGEGPGKMIVAAVGLSVLFVSAFNAAMHASTATLVASLKSRLGMRPSAKSDY